MRSADSCSRMHRLVFAVSAAEEAVWDDLEQLTVVLTHIKESKKTFYKGEWRNSALCPLLPLVACVGGEE